MCQTETGNSRMNREQQKAAVEAILFTMGDSVETDKIAKALDISGGEMKKIIDEMKEGYEQEDRGIRLIELEDAVQLCTKPEMYEPLIRVASQPKKRVLTDVLLETLAIVAYKQPVTRLDIERIRGVKSDHAVNKLIEYDLIRELGRLDAPGRPLLFGTTEEFLRCFGVGSPDELPMLTPEQMEEFMSEAEEEMNLKVEV